MICKRRFDKPAAEIAQGYGESVSFDYRLYGYDNRKEQMRRTTGICREGSQES
jgi:hypothetical protein